MRNELDFINNIDIDKLNSFRNTTSDNLNIEIIKDSKEIDFSWVPMIEEKLQFIDNIVRNPRRFIVPEEEILIVEKTKKVNQETVKHLASHTSYIQDVDEDGTIKPSKLLNANKEETFDIYENRFIITLLKRLNTFLETFDEGVKVPTNNKRKNSYNYKAQTTIGREKINFNLALESTLPPENDLEKPEYDAMKERMKNIQIILMDFFNTNFIKSIMQATPVHSPIRKTNLILKDPNFKEALTLWEFLDEHEVDLRVRNKHTVENKVDDTLKNSFLITYFLDYCALNLEQKDSLLDEKYLMLKRLISECALASNMSANEFKKNINNIFDNIKKEEKRAIIKVRKACNNFINDYNIKMDRALNLLK